MRCVLHFIVYVCREAADPSFDGGVCVRLSIYLTHTHVLFFRSRTHPRLLRIHPSQTQTQTHRGLLVKTNDMHFIIYLSALVRAIVALHDVVQNKIQYKEHVRSL